MIEIIRLERSTVIRVAGDLEDVSSRSLADSLACADPHRFLIVDFRHFTSVDSGIMAVVCAEYRRRTTSFEVIIPPEGTVYRIFAVCGCLEFFARSADVSQARS